MNNVKVCKFFNQATRCSLLYAEKAGIGMKMEACDGWNDKCKFAKTEQQFADDGDRAIFVCRQRNLCDECKYTSTKCTLSMEG